jgi:hypothetical protein
MGPRLRGDAAVGKCVYALTSSHAARPPDRTVYIAAVVGYLVLPHFD